MGYDNNNGVQFDIRYDQGGIGGFPSAEKAMEYLRTHPDEDYSNLKLMQVIHHSGRTYAKEVAFTL